MAQPTSRTARRQPKPHRPQLKPFKFAIQAVVIEVDDTGGILGEKSAEPVVFYSAEAAKEWLDNFEANLAVAVREEPT